MLILFLTQVLATWHHKVAAASTSAKISKLQEEMSEIVSKLHGANQQVERLTQQTMGDPMMKCIESFNELPHARQVSNPHPVLSCKGLFKGPDKGDDEGEDKSEKGSTSGCG